MNRSEMYEIRRDPKIVKEVENREDCYVIYESPDGVRHRWSIKDGTQDPYLLAEYPDYLSTHYIPEYHSELTQAHYTYLEISTAYQHKCKLIEIGTFFEELNACVWGGSEDDD
jgi:hypothetical protein